MLGTVLAMSAIDVRAADAIPDTIAQRMLACTPCHGQDGRATNAGYFPRIAGKPAGYLYNQLVNFREGRRSYAPMADLIEHLSDPYLREIASHFASLDLPYPPPTPSRVSAQVLQRGERLVLRGDAENDIPACAHCHGRALTGVEPAIPGLVGLPRDYLTGQLGAWKAGQRHAAAPDCMAQIAARLTSDDIAAAAAWLSSRPVPDRGKPASTAERPMPMSCGGVQP